MPLLSQIKFTYRELRFGLSVRNTRIKGLKCCNWLQQTIVSEIKNSIRDGQIPQP